VEHVVKLKTKRRLLVIGAVDGIVRALILVHRNCLLQEGVQQYIYNPRARKKLVPLRLAAVPNIVTRSRFGVYSLKKSSAHVGRGVNE
jgi:hypothetical protein